jgi:type I restriction enzyme S subunit
MAEIRLQTIGDLCDAGLIRLQTGPFGSQLHAYDYVSQGVPVIPTEAIRDRRINHDVLPQISRSKANELTRHQLKVGDILFARRGAQATGHVGYIRKQEQGFICGTGAILLRVREGNNTVISEYLSHVFSNTASIEWFKFHAIGATMPNLNEGIIRSFPLVLPSLAEQQVISSLLSAIDDKIELARRMNETLEAMARAIFKDWFVDFGPTRAKAEGRAPYLAADMWSLFPAHLDDKGKPEGWELSTIGAEVEVVGGSTPSKTQPAFWDGEINWATPKDMSSLRCPVLLETDRKITQAGLRGISSGLLPAGTVLLSSRAPIGYLAIAEIPVAINQGFIAMRCNKRLSNVHVWLWTGASMDLILQKANGSTFQEISKSNFRPIPVLVPPAPIRSAFDGLVCPLYERIIANERETRTLAKTRDLLLPKLMSGEIRVREAGALAVAAQ